MGIKWNGGDTPAKLRRAYFAKKRAMEREASGAIGRAATQLEKAVKSRVFPAKGVSQQDAPAQRPIKLAGRSPVSTRVFRKDNRARVTLSRHWTPARTPAIQALFRRHGEEKALFRRGLVVRTKAQRRLDKRLKSAKSRRNAKSDGAVVEFIRFNGKRGKSLLSWAKRRDRGEQWRSHVVRLNKPEIIQDLQLNPSVKQAQPLVSGIFRDAARRGFRAKG